MSNSILVPYPSEPGVTEARVKELIRSTPTPGTLVKKNIEYQYKYENFTNLIATSFASNNRGFRPTNLNNGISDVTMTFSWTDPSRTDYIDTLDYDGANTIILNGIMLTTETWQKIDTVSQTIDASSKLYKAVSESCSVTGGNANHYAIPRSISIDIYARFSIGTGLIYLSSESTTPLHIYVTAYISFNGWDTNAQASQTVSIQSGSYDLRDYLTMPVRTWTIEAQY